MENEDGTRKMKDERWKIKENTLGRKEAVSTVGSGVGIMGDPHPAAVSYLPDRCLYKYNFTYLALLVVHADCQVEKAWMAGGCRD